MNCKSQNPNIIIVFLFRYKVYIIDNGHYNLWQLDKKPLKIVKTKRKIMKNLLTC